MTYREGPGTKASNDQQSVGSDRKAVSRKSGVLPVEIRGECWERIMRQVKGENMSPEQVAQATGMALESLQKVFSLTTPRATTLTSMLMVRKVFRGTRPLLTDDVLSKAGLMEATPGAVGRSGKPIRARDQGEVWEALRRRVDSSSKKAVGKLIGVHADTVADWAKHGIIVSQVERVQAALGAWAAKRETDRVNPKAMAFEKTPRSTPAFDPYDYFIEGLGSMRAYADAAGSDDCKNGMRELVAGFKEKLLPIIRASR